MDDTEVMTPINFKDKNGKLRGFSDIMDEVSTETHGFMGNLAAVVNETFKILNLPNLTFIQADMCRYLQYGEEGLSWEERNRVIIMAYRGVGKTLITAIYVLFCLNINVDFQFLIVSKTKEFAGDIAGFVREIVDKVWFFNHLSPSVEEDGTKDTHFAFNIAGRVPAVQPSVKALGILGQLAGNRADCAIGDDVETLDNSITPKKKSTVRKAVAELDPILKAGARIILLGTPQVQDSLYDDLVVNKGYRCRVWPARFPRQDQISVAKYANRLAPSILEAVVKNPALSWRIIDSKRFTEEDMRQRELSMGRSGFDLQYMLDMSALENGKFPLRLKDFIVGQFSGLRLPSGIGHGTAKISDELLYTPVLDADKDYWTRPSYISTEADAWGSPDLIHMFIDPSGKGEDETAYAIVASLKGTLFLLACGGFTGGYDDKVLEALAKLCDKFHVNTVDYEENFGQGMFGKLLQPFLRLYAKNTKILEENSRSSVQKERRICDILEPILDQHRLVVLEDVIVKDEETSLDKDGQYDPNYSLFYQIVKITRDRGCLVHDDRIDALASCVAHFVDQMAQDTDESELLLRAEQALRRREEYMRKRDEWYDNNQSEGVDLGSIEQLAHLLSL